MYIVILDDHQDAVRKLQCAELLNDYKATVYTNTVRGVSQLAVRLREAQVLILIKDRTSIPRNLLERLSKLKLIIQIGKVGQHIDLQACTELGIAVAEGSILPRVQAEHTWALIGAAMRRLPQYIGHLKHGGWQQAGLKSAVLPNNFGLPQRLSGKVLGLWGYNQVSRLLCKYAQAFDVKVVVWGDEQSKQDAIKDGQIVAPNKTDFLSNIDILSLHLEASSHSQDAIKYDDLAQMKSRAVLVNTAHPSLIKQDALLAALNRGRPSLAAIDVFENEPIVQGHALLRLENCICTPHIGYIDIEAYEEHFSEAFQTAIDFINKKPSKLLNPQVLSNESSIQGQLL